MFKFFVYVFICICICIPTPPFECLPHSEVSRLASTTGGDPHLLPQTPIMTPYVGDKQKHFWCISVLICFSLRFARPNKKCLHSDRVRSGLCLNTTNNLGLIWISIGGVEVGTILSMEGLLFLCYQIIYAADDVRCLFETLDKNKNLSVQ